MSKKSRPPAKRKATPAPAPPSRSSTTRATAGRPRAEPPPDRRTLDRELGTAEFAIRGWHRLVDLADYLSHLVDGRTTGLLAAGDPKLFERVVGLASVVKAAAQWFPLDDGPKPKFVALAEKYLAEGPHDVPVVVPLVVKGVHWNLQTGPVVRRKGAQGALGRLHTLAELKTSLAALIEPLTEEDLRIHLVAYRSRPKQGWLLPLALADHLQSALTRGALTDLLREANFSWNWGQQRTAIADALALYLSEEARLGRDLGAKRSAHLEKLAKDLIVVALKSLGLRIPKDLFRDRRSRT